MKTLNLQVVHRILLKGMLDGEGKKGHSLSELNEYFKIIDKINFTEEESKDYEFKQELLDPNDASKGASLRWQTLKNIDGNNTEIDILKPFEISDEQAQLLKTIIEEKNKAKEFTVSDIKITDVADQLEIKLG